MKPKQKLSGVVTSASAQGGRSHQEDRAVHEWIESDAVSGWLLAVFDGHGGAETAEQAARTLPSLFPDRLKENRGDVAQSLRDIFQSLHELTREHVSGATATVVFVSADAKVATLAVLGDSPIAVLDAQGRAHFGPDHNVRTNLGERASAEARGGVYRHGYLEDRERPGIGLQMARSLGDVDLSRVLERAPEVETVPLGGQGIVLVGTDGLLSQGGAPPSTQLRNLLTLIQKGAGAEGIVAYALARGTDDNVTAIVWRSKGNVSAELP
jgi:serine/threonine protein phosphatase PrpC